MDTEPLEYRLALRARDGDREALEELIERERLRLFALAYAELRNYEDAQDALAWAAARICLNVQALREPARVRQWMNTVTRNEARRLRRPPRCAPLPLEDGDPSEAAATLRLDIARALRRLPAEQAYAVSRFHVAGTPIAEIARQCGRPEGTIKRWLHFGRRKLAEEMEGYAPMEPSQDKLTAAILGEPGEEMLGVVTRALLAAGFARVHPLAEMPPLSAVPAEHGPEYHLPEPLSGARLVVIDDGVSGGRWLEQTVLLRATEEGKRMWLCQLLSSSAEPDVYKAWTAGCDMCFTKQTLNEDELARLAARLLATRRAEAGAGAEGP